MLSFELDEDLVALQSTARAFATREVRPVLRMTEKSGPSRGLREKFDELGLMTLDWPERAGGAGLGSFYRVVVEEELSYGDLGTAFALDRGGAAAAFLRVLDTEQAHVALRSLSEGEGRAAFAAAEEGRASLGFRTTARRDSSGWTITGKKGFVLGADSASVCVVLAQIENTDGLSGAGAFLVPATAGWRIGQTPISLGLGGVSLNQLVFEEVKVASEARLDPPGELPALLRKFFDALSLTTASRAVGVARASYEYALAYAQERQAFGKPIGHFQSIAFLLAEMATSVEATRGLLWKAAWQAARSQATAEIAAAQAQSLETAFFCTNSAVQILGGAGYVQDHPVEKWMRDAKVLCVYGLHAQAASATLVASELGASLSHEDLFPFPSLHPCIT